MSAPFNLKDLMPSDAVRVHADECLYQGFFNVRKLKVEHRLFEGAWSPVLQREVVERHDAVGVLLFDPRSQRVALIEQFRIGAYVHPPLEVDTVIERQHQAWMLELVAGLIDKVGEEPEAVARRESEEESGCVVTDLLPIARYFSSPGSSTEYFHSYCGIVDLSDNRRDGQCFGLESEGEDIRLHIITLEQAFAAIDQGLIANSHTLIALQWLRSHHQSLSAT